MGNVTSQYLEAGLDRVASYWTKPRRILLLGLDGAGKTTLLCKMKLGGEIEAISTISLNVETIKYEKTVFTIWDLSGRQRLRQLWGFYMYSKNTDAVIYVIDSADRDRIDEAVLELHRVFDEDALRDCKLLVLANKQDQPDCMSVEELQDKLALHRVTRNSTYITKTVATSGQGINKGMTWLSRAVADK